MKPVYIIFGTSSPRPIPIKTLWWVLRRKPIIVYAYWLGWWTKILTRSSTCHVAVGVDGVVYDSTVAGANFWPWIPYWIKTPGLTHYTIVWTDNPPDLTRYEKHVGKRQSAWKTVLKYYTYGFITLSADCADVTIDCLRQMGMQPPRKVRSPDGIDKWLKTQGREVVRLPRPSAHAPRNGDAVD